MWLEDGGLHPWRKKIDCKHPERNDQFCLLLSSIVLLISALTVMCIQENCLFLLDMAGTSEACEVSSTRNARGGREKISPHSTENAYTRICIVSKGKAKRTMCEWISEPRIFLWDITRLLVVVFLFWVHKDLSRLRGCSYHSKKLWMGRTLRRSSQGMNWCKGWQNFPKFRLVILHKQLSTVFLTLIVFSTNRDSWNRIIEYGI